MTNIKLKNREPIKGMIPLRRTFETEFEMSMIKLRDFEVVKIDPDHYDYLKNMSVSEEIIKIYNSSRDLFELRFKRKIAISSTLARKAGIKFKVNHCSI